MSIYKACDIRGRFDEELTVAHAARLGAAIAQLRGPCEVLVCGDGRVSTSLLKGTLIESLVASGCQVTDLGTGPTPLFYFARARLGIDVGVMVTASHNPAQDNGFKVTLGPLPVTEGEMQALAERMEAGPRESTSGSGGCDARHVDLLPEYLAFLSGFAPSLQGMSIVVDCASGMAALAARQVWSRTGARMTYLLDKVDGRFPGHAPNPAEAKNLVMLQQAVRETRADLGVAYDGDADRVAFMDEQGEPVTGDQAIVLFARDALRQGVQPVVYDQKCSRVVPETVRALGGEAIRERSGHTYIKRAFLERGAIYAGEMSGHHFFRSVGGDDGLAAGLIFARLLKESGQPLSALRATVPSYPITPDLRIPMDPGAADEVLAVLRAALQGEAVLDDRDGLRIEFPDGWGLVRRSVTEPVMTLRFEGSGEESLARILRRVEEACPPLRGRLFSG